MEKLIHHAYGVKAIAWIIIEPLLGALVAFGWWPAADFIILQVDNSVLLNPFMNQLLQDLKIILGVLISFAVLLKIIVGIIKLKNTKS